MNFFILGNPRSGTTLFRLMLNNHPNIGVPPESGFLHWWYKKYKNWTINDTINIDSLNLFLNDILSSKKIEDWNLKQNELKDFIIINKPNTYIEIIDCIYKYYCKSKLIIGDKNNYYIHHLEELNEIVPNAKYIHIIRDGRDVACSYININKLDQNLIYLPKVSSNIIDIANEWNQNIIKIENFIQKHDSLTIRYEDLIENPTSILEKVCIFLKTEFCISMLKYNQDSNNDEPTSTLHWKRKTLEDVDSSNKQKFLQLLSKDEINTFNSIAIENLKKFQYEK